MHISAILYISCHWSAHSVWTCVFISVSMILHWTRFSRDNLDQESFQIATAQTVQFLQANHWSGCKTQRNRPRLTDSLLRSLRSEKDVRWRWTRKGESSRDRFHYHCYSGSRQFDMWIYQRGSWCAWCFGSVVWIRGMLSIIFATRSYPNI